MTYGHFILVMMIGIATGVVAATPNDWVAWWAVGVAVGLIVLLWFWQNYYEKRHKIVRTSNG